MIEWAMLAALGFLAASLLALMLAPLLWRRAVHLTTMRVRSTLPLSLADIQADKDQLRAQFAMSLRSVEVKLEQVEEKLALQRIETARAEQGLREAQAEIAGKQNLIIEQENELAGLKEQLLKTEEDAANNLRALGEANRRLVETTKAHEEELARLHEMNLALDERRVELVALKTRLASADPALGLRIQGLLSQQEEERRVEALATAEALASQVAVNGATAGEAAANVPEVTPLSPAGPDVNGILKAETAAAAPIATIKVAGKVAGEKVAGERSAAKAANKPETVAHDEQPRRAVSMPVAEKFEIKPKAASAAVPAGTPISQATPRSPQEHAVAKPARDAAAGPALPERAPAQSQPAAAVTSPGSRPEESPADAGKPVASHDNLQDSLESLQKDLTDPQARASGTDMRKRLSDMTARLTKAAIEADGADGKLAKLLKAKGKGSAATAEQPSGPISLAKVSSVAAARASTSLMDRIKGFDKAAKN